MARLCLLELHRPEKDLYVSILESSPDGPWLIKHQRPGEATVWRANTSDRERVGAWLRAARYGLESGGAVLIREEAKRRRELEKRT